MLLVSPHKLGEKKQKQMESMLELMSKKRGMKSLCLMIPLHENHENPWVSRSSHVGCVQPRPWQDSELVASVAFRPQRCQPSKGAGPTFPGSYGPCLGPRIQGSERLDWRVFKANLIELLGRLCSDSGHVDILFEATGLVWADTLKLRLFFGVTIAIQCHMRPHVSQVLGSIRRFKRKMCSWHIGYTARSPP